LIGDADLAMPLIHGHYQPLAALYRSNAVRPAIIELLRLDRLAAVFLVESVRTRVVLENEMATVDPTLQTLHNLNHPEDYERALREAGLGE
jgi:molybdopterin-guanine dinucleotide biosynthesis protein A